MAYSANCTTLVYNEDLQAFMAPATYRAQMLLPVPGKGLYSLPLAGQSRTVAGSYSLWLHRGLPTTGPTASAANYYGFAHGSYAEFVVLGTSSEVQKELQNVLLVCDGPDPLQLDVNTPTQGSFEQALLGKAAPSILQRNLQRKSDTTYATVQAPSALPWGGRARGKWLRLRLRFSLAEFDSVASPREQSRLLKVQTTVRDVFD